MDEGERPEDALVRELHEELAISAVAPAEPLAHVQGADFRMYIWLVDEWSGEPENHAPEEHDALGWFDLQQAQQLRLADPRLLDLITTALVHRS